MDTDQSFARIEKYIKDGRTGLVRPEIDMIVDGHRDDLPILIKCASLLKVIDDERGTQRILDMVVDSVPKDDGRFSIAVALRGLNRPEDALDILVGLDRTDEVRRELARSYLAAGDAGSALSSLPETDTDGDDVILRTDILCALGRLDEAYGGAEELVRNDGSYGPLVNLCTVMIRMGMNKEAVKLARSHIKEDKRNIDSLALGAYVMWINGKIPAAANLAHSALKIDHRHIGALETMAMCLIHKRKFIEAKLMAGAINDQIPGHPAAIRILDACRIAAE